MVFLPVMSVSLKVTENKHVEYNFQSKRYFTLQTYFNIIMYTLLIFITQLNYVVKVVSLIDFSSPKNSLLVVLQYL